MPGMGFEGAYGAMGTLKGVQDWIDERRRAKQFEQDNLLFEQQQQDRQRQIQEEGEARSSQVQAFDQFKSQLDALDIPPFIKIAALMNFRKTGRVDPQIVEMMKPPEEPKPTLEETVDDQGRPVKRAVVPRLGMPDLPVYQPPKEPKTLTIDTSQGGRNRTLVMTPEQALAQGSFDAPIPREPREPQGPQSGFQWVTVPGQEQPLWTNQPPPRSLPFRPRVEQSGRGVLSGDANRLAEMDLGADMLKALRSELPKGSTGFAPGLAARVPNILTGTVQSVTRGGIDVVGAKQRLATQKLVKQIIGKALEGGVLREHDEQKYEHIIPTLDDADEVVESKLGMLDAMIQQKREVTLDSLGAGGFDISRFDRTVGKVGPQQPAPGRPAPSGGGGNRIRYDKQGNRVP